MDGVPTTELVAAMVKPTAGKSHGASTLMTDGEFQDFWHLLDARRFAEFQQQAAPTPSPGRTLAELGAHGQTGEWGSSEGARSRPHKTHRCGTCRGCTSSDCGACKNCRDKPR